jgi:purine-binding chemotaxis protein CheW
VIERPAIKVDAVTHEISEPQPALRACLFVLAGSLFAVDVMSAREVAIFEGFTLVPWAPPVLVGIANLRGVIMPIVDIRPLLHLPPHRPGTVIKSLVIEEPPIRVAVAIEAALGLEPFTRMISQTGPHPFALGLLPRGGELVTLLDAPAILDALSRKMRKAHDTEEDRG